MLLINFTGAPGAGKSTLAAGLFHRLKTRHWNVELVTEYTKELILTGDQWTLADELIVFAEKYKRIKRLENVDLVITDSPLVNSAIYGGDQFSPAAAPFYQEVARSFDSLYFAVRRVAPYIPLGRMPDSDAADAAGAEIVARLEAMEETCHLVEGHDRALDGIITRVEREAARRGLKPLATPSAA